MKPSSINVTQMMFIIIAAVGLTNHVIIIPFLITTASKDGWVSAILSFSLYILWSSIIIFLLRKTANKHIYTYLKEIHPIFALIICSIFCIYFVFMGAIALKVTVDWTVTSYLPNTPTLILAAIFLLPCVLAAFAGLEVIAIAATFLVPIIIFLGLFVATANIPNKEYSLLLPVLENGWNPILNGVIYSSGGLIEILLLLFFHHRLNKPVKWSVLLLLGLILTGITIGPFLGAIAAFGLEEAKMLRYPAFEEWRLVHIGSFIEHMDFFSIYQWLAGAFIRISLCIYLAVHSFNIQQKRKKMVWIGIITIILFIPTVLSISDEETTHFLFKWYFPFSFIVMVSVTLLLLFLILLKKKGRMNGIKQGETRKEKQSIQDYTPLTQVKQLGLVKGQSQKEINEETIRQQLSLCGDVSLEKYASMEGPVLLVFCNGLVEKKQINQMVLPSLSSHPSTLELIPLEREQGMNDVIQQLFSGYLVLYFEKQRQIYFLDISNVPNRHPEESSFEVSIKGPRDAFTEDIGINMALIRKRLKTASLAVEYLQVGKRSQTKVALLFMSDITNPSIVSEARKRLKKINVDVLNSVAQLEEMVADSRYSLVPLVDYVSRPDYVVEILIRGKIAILLDGSPSALIAPTTPTTLTYSPEDSSLPYFFVSLQKIMRYTSFLIAILLPGFYICLTSFQIDQLPFRLMTTITLSRFGLPLPDAGTMFFILIALEVFKEAGIRLPKAVGGTVSVVGGLIIGQASIDAGLISSPTLVVAGITMIASYTLVNQSLAGSVVFLRLFVFIFSSILGFFGFFVSLMLIVVYVASLKSFNVPYLSAFSTPTIYNLLGMFFRFPFSKQAIRLPNLDPKDSTRQGEDRQ